jgi:RNA-directed DNA polymerase
VSSFDRIDHHHLLRSLGTFPARDATARWLNAGVMDGGERTPTTEGTPQGGVISPLLLNVALHGMEDAAGVRYVKSGTHLWTARTAPVLVRYADDLLVFCHSRQLAEQIKARLARWLAPRGLVFNEDKTRVVHLDEGCEFLGCSIRRHRGKLLIKPSAAAMRRIRKRLTAEVRSLRGANAAAVIARLNPIIRGWAAYYRIGVSSEAFQSLDKHVWDLTYGWARHTHRKKPKHWIVNRYYGQFHPARKDRWVFGDPNSRRYLARFAWTRIVRHTMVKGDASPDDPALTEYWARRRAGNSRAVPSRQYRLLAAQGGLCTLCGRLLLDTGQEPQSPQEWEQWLRTANREFRVTRIASGREPNPPDGRVGFRLVHVGCLRHGADSRPVSLHANEPSGLA